LKVVGFSRLVRQSVAEAGRTFLCSCSGGIMVFLL
jgi:hypothetical protein